ncbi:MAG: M23 family metallopeptidase [Candidatus Omnitrophota bacterium]|nr:M23 family metallopeptidase [Candidatus Omnitrophota bacterium]
MRSKSFWLGMLAGLALTAAAVEAPYINWRFLVPPVDEQPLRLRHDAKGDGRFGAPRSGQRSHRGVDLLAPLSSSVRAIRSGTVIRTGTHRGLGHFVELSHRKDLTSLYAHLATTTVTQGQRVSQGQIIGTVGKTGNARHPWISPHLHLEVARHGEILDPAELGLRALASAETSEHDAHGRGGD